MNTPSSSPEAPQSLGEALEQEGVDVNQVTFSSNTPAVYDTPEQRQTLTKIYSGPDGTLYFWEREVFWQEAAENGEPLKSRSGYVCVTR